MLHKAAAVGLVSILLLQILGFTVVHSASAQERYASLTYNGQIDISFEDNQGYSNGRGLVGNIKLPFTITLDQPQYAGSNEISGKATVQGTFSGSFKWGGSTPPSGCVTQYQITATYTTTIYGQTNVQANKVFMTGGYVPNVAWTASPAPARGCQGWPNSLGIESLLADCFGTQPNKGGYYTNAACYELPIQGGSQTIARGSGNTAPTSVTGTIQLTLVDSKKVDSFDFDIAVTPAELKVYKGGTATYAVSVSTIKGKATQVTLSAPNVEGLGRLALDRTTGTPPFNAKLTVPAGQAKLGRYALQVVGTAGDVRKATPVTLVVEDCPKLAITPTMPAANDPREFATPNGKASFRFDIEWNGKLPMSVGLNAVVAGGGTIQPSFAFNPVRLTNSKVNIIMDVATINTVKGDYPIAVTATINDPELPRECSSAAANVVLVVGDSRAQDLPLQPRPNQPPQPNLPPPQPENPAQPQPIKIADQRGNVTTRGNLVQTGNDGKARIPSGNTTVEVNRNTKVWRLNLDDINDDFAAEDLRRRPPVLAEIIYKKLKTIWGDIKFEIKSTWHDIDERVTRSIDCFYASGREIVDPCLDRKTWYLEGGDVHYGRRKGLVVYPVDTSDVFVTPDAVMVPNGTEFVLSLDENGNTKLTVLEGSVLYIQLSTKQVMLLNATQQLAVQTQQPAGGNSASNRVTAVDLKDLDRWWLQGNVQPPQPLPQVQQPPPAAPEPPKPELAASIASPSGIGDEMTGAVLGTLIVFMFVTGAFLRPSVIRNKQPSLEEPRKERSKFRPRKMALLGALLIFVPFSILASLTLSNAVSMSENLAIGMLAITWIAGFGLILIAAPLKLIIDKARKKKS